MSATYSATIVRSPENARFGISAVYMENSSGESTYPFDTSVPLKEEISLSRLILIFQPSKYDVTTWTMLLVHLVRLIIKPSCHNLSNALDTSREIITLVIEFLFSTSVTDSSNSCI